jgi:hypothetical protein
MTGEEKPPCQPMVVQRTFSVLISPFVAASTATIMPISFDARFSSEWVRIAVPLWTTAPVLMPRFEISYFQTISPVCGLMA